MSSKIFLCISFNFKIFEKNKFLSLSARKYFRHFSMDTLVKSFTETKEIQYIRVFILFPLRMPRHYRIL